jgi:hypothetical protein
MYILLCQVFLALTGCNLPEEVFDSLFYLLQGDRSGRKKLVKSVREFAKQSPHQVLLTDIPYHLYRTYDNCRLFNKALFSRDCKELLFKDSRENNYCKPVWKSQTIWVDKSYDKPLVRMNLVLYMETEEDKNKIMKNMREIKETYTGYRLNWLPKCRTLDISWMCSCVFCGDFMKIRSDNLRKEKKDIEIICDKINRFDCNYGSVIKSPIKRSPVCSLCRDSKERQGEYRMNMLSRGDWGETLYHERDYQYHRTIGDMYPKPDLSVVPKDIDCKWKTPLDYSPMLYWNMTDPMSDTFWHPDLTADEYMRLMEYRESLFINENDPDPLDDDLWDQFEEDP